MTRDEMRQAVLRVLELPIPDSDEEREKWRLLVAEQIVDSLGLEPVGMIGPRQGEITHRFHDGAPAGPENEMCNRIGCVPAYALRGDR